MRRVTDDDRRQQTPATIAGLAPYTMCRRASNNMETPWISMGYKTETAMLQDRHVRTTILPLLFVDINHTHSQTYQ